jgi:hypothetical protein
MELHCQEYLNSHSRFWESQRFVLYDLQFQGAYVYRRRIRGATDTFIIPVCPETALTNDLIRTVGGEAFDFGLQYKNWLVRGLFGTPVIYPLFLVSTVSPEVAAFVREIYIPMHWASFEVPVVLTLPDMQLIMLETTPILGGAYYPGFRREAQTLFMPGVVRLREM